MRLLAMSGTMLAAAWPCIARCQTGGKLLADRALSRLLKKDWPRTLDELERVKGKG